MCGYQGYQTVEEVASACELQGATTSSTSTESATLVVDNILDKVGLFRNFLIEQCDDINNALAVTMPLEGGDLERYILYDQDFFSKVSASTGTDWGNTSILAHEVGHHLNGHTLKSGGSNHKIELQADEFSGFVLARMQCSLEDAQSAVSKLLPDEGSATHPAKADRLHAIKKGWYRGNGKTIPTRKIEDVKKEIENIKEVENDIEINDEKEVEEIIANTEEELIQAILGRYIEAIGGQEKVSQIKTFYQERKIISNMKINGEEMKSELTSKLHFLKPSQLYQEMTTKTKENESAFEILIVDGKTYIKMNLNKDWVYQKDSQSTFTKNSTSYVIEYSQLINNAKATYLGIKEINNIKCHVVKFDKIELATNMEMISTKYFNTESGLLLFEDQIVLMKNASFTTETISKTTYKDYKEVDGILFSLRQELEMETKTDKQTFKSKATTLFSEIQINPTINTSKFKIDD
ncbi:hypothetical protein KO494_03300 [Lacinutrix sp. C3R15]|uniref:hypothetical protein n=1 Tax=Flavobacteriaceae TaxID=49546 RepID=UPI001C08652B|nr:MULTISPECIES: hypothetical protein [Flavobacteriaceae]MBU2938558.1 hypothetical protein [Lacinutrix sp. C3R15]MDO6621872.1 hypothetical protein [Oceanihabitans sp. 1_MG-2023]